MKTLLKSSCAALLAIACIGTAVSTRAADKKEKGDKTPDAPKLETPAAVKAKALPYSGTLTAKTADSITLKKKEAEKTFSVTSTTKITKAGKPATLEDAVIGEPAGVSYVDNNGKAEAKTIHLGAKPEKAGGEKKAGKADKAEKK